MKPHSHENREVCCVVDSFCYAPANYDPPILKAECFVCGQKVCLNCSSKRKYSKYGKVRMCNNCQIEIDGNDKIVIKRLRKKAKVK